MKPYSTYSYIIAGLALIYLGYVQKGFFVINYYIGGAAIIMGIYNLIKHPRKT